jgi:hypothetical protein
MDSTRAFLIFGVNLRLRFRLRRKNRWSLVLSQFGRFVDHKNPLGGKALPPFERAEPRGERRKEDVHGVEIGPGLLLVTPARIDRPMPARREFTTNGSGSTPFHPAMAR